MSYACSICLDSLKNPLAMPCGHINCGDCIQQVVQNATDKSNVNCPTCRATFDGTTDNTDDIPRLRRWSRRRFHSALRRVFLPVDLVASGSRTREREVDSNNIRDSEQPPSRYHQAQEHQNRIPSNHDEWTRSASDPTNSLRSLHLVLEQTHQARLEADHRADTAEHEAVSIRAQLARMRNAARQRNEEIFELESKVRMLEWQASLPMSLGPPVDLLPLYPSNLVLPPPMYGTSSSEPALGGPSDDRYPFSGMRR